MKYFSLTTRIAVLAAPLIFWLSPAALHAQSTTSSVQLPLAGTVFVPMSDGSFDGVALSGFAHVFSYVRTFIPGSPPIADPFRIQINLDQVSGVGNVTGFRYQGTGAFRINLPTAPIDPINVSFDLVVAGVPPNPIVPSGPPILPLDIVFLVNFPRGYAEQFFYPVDLRARALAPGRSPHMGEAIVGWVEAYFADTHPPKRWVFQPTLRGKTQSTTDNIVRLG